MEADTIFLQVAHVVPCTEAEGPGKRYALWFQGCPLRCPGCCNPEFLSFQGGERIGLSRIVCELEHAKERFGIEGITLLGGEPFAHLEGALAFAQAAQLRSLSVMIFSGYTLEEIREMDDPRVGDLLCHTDLLVDGPYLRELPDSSRRWIGSTNQRIHFLTDRYRPDDPCWKQKNTLEIRLINGELSVNGFPATHADTLWKGRLRQRSQ